MCKWAQNLNFTCGAHFVWLKYTDLENDFLLTEIQSLNPLFCHVCEELSKQSQCIIINWLSFVGYQIVFHHIIRRDR
jgi:hypothetical protein